jgi:hypothetical protein
MSDRIVTWRRPRDGKRTHAFGSAAGPVGTGHLTSECSRWFSSADLVAAAPRDRECGTCRLVLDSWRATQDRSRSA